MCQGWKKTKIVEVEGSLESGRRGKISVNRTAGSAIWSTAISVRTQILLRLSVADPDHLPQVQTFLLTFLVITILLNIVTTFTSFFL